MRSISNMFKIIKLKSTINDYNHITEHLSYGNFYLSQKKTILKHNMGRKYCSVSSNNEHQEEDIYINKVANGDKEVEHKLKVILLEAEVMRQEGKPIPEKTFFTLEHWRELLTLPSRTARKKYFEYLFKISKKKENRKVKRLDKQLKKEVHDKSKSNCESLEEFALKYDLAHNNIFLRFYDTTINQMYNNRLIQAMLFGQKLVIDCGFDQNMTRRENKNCAKQLMLLFAENRIHDDPFDLHYCNTNPDGVLMKEFNKFIPNLYDTSFPINLHQGSYMDLFPKDQLIYLTPHCRQEITEFDYNAVYIIGAIVDKVNNEPLSLAKAKKEGLRMAKLPLDKYLQWGTGSGKKLTLNQVLSILNDIKLTGDWNFALRHVPKRKLIEYSIDDGSHKSEDSLQLNSNSRLEKKWMPSSVTDFKKLIHNKR